MVTQEQIDKTRLVIASNNAALAAFNTDDLPEEKKALIEEAAEELRKAEEALNRAQAAANAGDDNAAKAALRECWEHIEKAAKLIKQVTE